jgi:hypothetical protein
MQATAWYSGSSFNRRKLGRGAPVNADSSAILNRIQKLLDVQIRTTMSALAASSGSLLWRDYQQREIEIRELLEELEVAGSRSSYHA